MTLRNSFSHRERERERDEGIKNVFLNKKKKNKKNNFLERVIKLSYFYKTGEIFNFRGRPAT